MAHFWKEEEIPKHEDTTTKRKLNQDDIQFLKELQMELNTQNHCGTANPRYWGILEEKTFPTDSDYADDYVVFCSSSQHTMRSAEDLYDYLFELQEEEPKLNYLLFANNTLTIVDDKIHIEIKYLSDSEVEQLIEYINHLYYTDLEWIPVIKREIIRKDALFITQKSATEHLKRNEHNYTEDARTYCMHAYRCPEYERLLEILSIVDWNEVQNG